ncbi:hypothetical protein Runsl_1184 [Runella slithyformis DSM 19594]|uniref:Uncharacterized protein n=1 Tax=Runella slithyformis (strain ATCC 29530 / DSM 19594 / LMG 11500 / NCIMB 11436 / LSU 4) TaxID=761193 RepID=A0A7U4E4N4_RUNSL|nr:hypothetical protein Runsl_1184 [Runella slithyformis DSM 19594]
MASPHNVTKVTLLRSSMDLECLLHILQRLRFSEALWIWNVYYIFYKGYASPKLYGFGMFITYSTKVTLLRSSMDLECLLYILQRLRFSEALWIWNVYYMLQRLRFSEALWIWNVYYIFYKGYASPKLYGFGMFITCYKGYASPKLYGFGMFITCYKGYASPKRKANP